MKIFDCFTYFEEIELLELRLQTVYSVVDFIVLVEANRTFTGKEKEFVFEKNKHKFSDFLDKIIYIKVEDMPVSVAVDVNGTSIHAIAPKIWQAKIGKIPVTDAAAV